ncbi:PadR family transcriptional regulator [Staphylococcus arlettae]|uniref:Transcriptional regulator PadR-like family n=1 Tax=Staphylococcus arlettae TaxID=29378 RepID=A0A380CR04_9STAP|nr:MULTISPECIES: helix-turn-helix transcriptional regulator [Staphylococcus]HAP2020498.1 PadR family transcriptional regulator [Escherichia coli]HJG39568.1 helix-turn-helix transcriptional regulator [Staphylococcus saprophyticus]MEB5899277.1 helix-turn-helix transcriptional regulator [Staphylococcus arlettae]NKE85553.1 PadR family transcriptional regulator [Staphylococcus arlettae]PNZ53637.1 transcriptional regulator [Staphylococcus arlettae]
MSIQIFILSKLMEKNTYPYLLKKELSEPIPYDKMSDLTENKLYYHFEKLSKKEFIEVVETIKEENRPDKQVFKITEQGKENLPNMMYKLFENANEIEEIYVGIAYLKYVDRKKVVTILENKVQDFKYSLKQSKEFLKKYETVSKNEELLNFMWDYFNSKLTYKINFLEKIIETIKNRDI